MHNGMMIPKFDMTRLIGLLLLCLMFVTYNFCRVLEKYTLLGGAFFGY
jgi:hypothetical protein